MSTQPSSTMPARNWGGILLVHFGRHGHTALAAERLARQLRAHGLRVDVRDVAHATEIDPVRHDVVVVGASLQREPMHDALVAWVADHRGELGTRPTALFSVLLTDDDGWHEDKAVARAAIGLLNSETGWKPDRAVPLSDGRAIDRFADEISELVAAPLMA